MTMDKKARILVVDDNPNNLQVIGNILSEKGFELAFSLSGSEALGYLKKEKPDLILLDVMMPEMNGYALCKKIKADPDLRQVPVIFLTALSEVENVALGFKAGAVDYITKPFNYREFLARVNTHVELHAARQQLLDSNRRLEDTNKQLHRTLKKLEASEQLHRGVVNTMRDGMVIVGKDGRIRFVNTAFCNIYGYSQEELVGMNILELIRPDYHHVGKGFVKALEVENHFQGETIDIRKDGTEFFVEVKGGPILYGGRNCLLAVVRDVSRRKQLENELRDALSFSQAVTSALPLGVAVYESTGQCRFANLAAPGIIGATPEQMMQQNFRHIESWLTSGLLEMAERCLVEKENGQKEVHITTSFGKELWLNCRCVSFASGPDLQLLLLYEDITGRKMTQEALRISEERLGLAIEAARIGIWDLDLKNNDLVWDKRMFSIFGITPDTYERTEEAWKKGAHPDDLPGMNEALQKATHGRRQIDTEFRVVWPDGSIRHIRAFARITYDSSGQAVRVTGAALDISDVRKAEEALREGERLQGVLEMAGAVCHEINQPLMAINGYSELLGASVSQDDRAKEIHSKLILQIDKMAEITRRLMNITRYETMDYLDSKIIDINKSSEQPIKRDPSRE